MAVATVTPPPAPAAPAVPEVSAWVGATRLAKARGVKYESKTGDTGSWSIELSVTDSQNALLDYGTIVSLKEFGSVVEFGLVVDIIQSTVMVGEEAAQTTVYSGQLVSEELGDALVYGPTTIVPWTGGHGLDGLRLATVPYTDTRYYNWASRDLNRTGWTAAVELFTLGQNPPLPRPFGFGGKPAGWPAPACNWIAPRAISGGAHPNGTWYTTATFSTVGAGAFSCDFFMACGPDDSAELWVDGVQVCVIEATDSTKAKTFNLALSDDTHVAVAKVVHGGSGASGEITGFALEALRHYDDGGGLLMSPILRTSAVWTCVDLGQPTPGWYVDQIIADMFGEGQTRGCYAGWTVGVNTTTHTDSNGQKLPLVGEFSWRVGDGLLAGLKGLAENYIEWGYDRTATNGRKLLVAGIKGDAVPGGGTYTGLGTASGHTFTPGSDGLNELVHHGTAPDANVILSRWDQGFLELPITGTGFRRKEAFLSLADTKDGVQTFWNTAKVGVELSTPSESVDTFRHRLKSAKQYRPGDTITTRNRAGAMATWRCTSRAVSTDDDGNGSVTATLGSKRDDVMARIDRWQRRTLGTLDGRSESAVPSSQWVTHTATLTPVQLHFTSGGGSVTIVGDRGSPLRAGETLLLLSAEIEADVAGATGATTCKIEVNGTSIGTVTAPVGVRRGVNNLSRVLFTVFDWANVETTVAGGHSGVTVTVYAMAATWS